MAGIDIVPYDPRWTAAFEDERERIAAALGSRAVRIDHHGSTAVPGLAAKPIIDIQVSVSALQPLAPYVAALATLGYVHVPHADDSFCPFFHRPSTWPHTHHVHLVRAGGEEERRTLAFRDALRADPDLRQEYESLKRALAAAYDGGDAVSREAYANAKSDFVEGVVARAFVQHYYDAYAEEERLDAGPFSLEFERTKEIVRRHLPPAPASIVDVGGAAGAYSLWLAALGHEVHLVDSSARLVEAARQRSSHSAAPLATLQVGDATRLPQADESADVVLVMGPPYHLIAARERAAALAEAFRVVKRPGFVAVAAISRYASALDGLARNLALDPQFVSIRDRDLRDGQHRNPSNHPDYFTTAYFHTPEGLRAELIGAGFDEWRIVGVEGPAWLLADFDRRWADPAQRDIVLDTARALEAEPSVIGASAHLLGLAWKR